jgi:hypothetical protein
LSEVDNVGRVVDPGFGVAVEGPLDVRWAERFSFIFSTLRPVRPDLVNFRNFGKPLSKIGTKFLENVKILFKNNVSQLVLDFVMILSYFPKKLTYIHR